MPGLSVLTRWGSGQSRKQIALVGVVTDTGPGVGLGVVGSRRHPGSVSLCIRVPYPCAVELGMQMQSYFSKAVGGRVQSGDGDKKEGKFRESDDGKLW